MNVHDSDSMTFGAWLKQARQTQGLTQADFAHQIGCSIHLVRKIEANERRPSKQIVDRIADCLGVAPSTRIAFLRFARTAPSTLRRASTHKHVPLGTSPKASQLDLAASSPLIGRDLELAELHRRLCRQRVRLLTLLGPPGIGKTRLAVELAAEISDAFADGVHVAALAPLNHAEQVPVALAHLLGVPAGSQESSVERLIEVLHQQHVLLVLDNFEHLLAAAAVVDTLLAHCPRLKVLVTSQVPLHLSYEQTYRVPALGIPDAQSPSGIATIARYSAVALFVARAHAVNPSFALNEQNVDAVIAICRRLDGLPLAIELIAARTKLLPPRALLTRLEGAYQAAPLTLLASQHAGTDHRHQTLHRAIAWSYELLNPAEKNVLGRLAVFRGSSTLSAAEVVCSHSVLPAYGASVAGEHTPPDAEVLNIVESLLDKSLLVLEHDDEDEPRFMLLETIQAYALERLRASDDAEPTYARHAEFYLLQAESAQRHLQAPQQSEWLAWLERDHPNLRQALQWFIHNNKFEQAARMCVALWRFWWERDHVREGLQWAEQVPADTPLPLSLRAKLLYGTGVLWYASGNMERAMSLLENSLVRFRALDDQPNVANVLNYVGAVYHSQSKFAEAKALYEQSLDIRHKLQDLWNVAISLNNLGALAHAQGDFAEAQRLCQQSVAVWQELGDHRSIVYPHIILGLVALDRGEFQQAAQQFQASLELLQDQGSQASIADCLEGLAAAAAQGQRYEWSAQMMGAAAQLRKHIGVPLTAAEQSLYEQRLAAVRVALGSRVFAIAWTEGRAMSLEHAVAYALSSSFDD